MGAGAGAGSRGIAMREGGPTAAVAGQRRAKAGRAGEGQGYGGKGG